MDNSRPPFEEVARLLAWKRHEQPPPGYFRHFSYQVLARLRLEQNQAPKPWWRAWLEQFDAKPLLISAYGATVCVLLFLGVNIAVTDDNLGFPSVQAETYSGAGDLFANSEPLTINIGFSSIGPSISTAAATQDHGSFPFLQAQTVRFAGGWR